MRIYYGPVFSPFFFGQNYQKEIEFFRQFFKNERGEKTAHLVWACLLSLFFGQNYQKEIEFFSQFFKNEWGEKTAHYFFAESFYGP